MLNNEVSINRLKKKDQGIQASKGSKVKGLILKGIES